MNYNENLLVVAQEECAEIQQAISKTLRFGEDNYHPLRPEVTNGYDVVREFYQLSAVMDMLIRAEVLPDIGKDAIEAIKVNKECNVVEYAKLSLELGRIK